VAQHHIATRLSYLDIKSDNDIARAQANAQAAFREASTQGYLGMVSLAGPAWSARRAAAAPPRAPTPMARWRPRWR
jgi:hypothetical protein